MKSSRWIYQNSILNEVPTLATHFVYKITEIKSGRIYIGYKSFFSKRKKNLLKKEKSSDKRKKTYKIEIKESNWREYNSSCKPLAELISINPKNFDKEILLICYNEKQARYYETKYQFAYNVLESNSFNSNILGKFFHSDILLSNTTNL